MAASRDEPAVANLYRAARSGRAGADPTRGRGRRARRARRSACAARWQRTRRSCLSCSPRPAAALGRARRDRRGQGGDRRLASGGLLRAAGMDDRTPTGTVERGGGARLQAAAADLHRSPAVGHAPEDRAGARQAQELRLADHQPGLFGAGAGAPSRHHLRALPFFAGGARDLPCRLSRRPPQAQPGAWRASMGGGRARDPDPRAQPRRPEAAARARGDHPAHREPHHRAA